MVEFLTNFFDELVGVFLDASPYILLGFAVAAGFQIFLPVSLVQRFLGRGRVRPIFAASLLGIPLPLCSCSVLPTALALKRRGASRGATLSFLVSTPETGVDSIALTYGLMDPLMATFRPFAALASALTTGFATELFGGKEKKDEKEVAQAAAEASCECGPEEPKKEAASGDSCCSSTDAGHDHDHDHGHSHGHTHDAFAAEAARREAARGQSWVDRLRGGFRSAFVEIFDETSHWMLAGLIISALISVLLPAEIVTRYLSSGPVPIFLMLFLGIPLYICASASTPIAAALVLKGLSPGAALVFLLAGPATNVGSLAILSRAFGRRVMTIYLATIAGMSVLLGVTLDFVYGLTGMDPTAKLSEHHMGIPMPVAIAASVVFAILLFFSFRRTSAPGEFKAIGRLVERALGLKITLRRVGFAAVAGVLVWGVSTCFVAVPPGSEGLITHFGAPVGEPRGPGIHFKLPPPFGEARIVAADAVRRVEIGFRTPGSSVNPEDTTPVSTRELEEESLFLTGDENLLAARAVLHYRVSDSRRFEFGFQDPSGTLKLIAIAQLVDVMAAENIDGVYTATRRRVEEQVLSGVRERLRPLNLGVEVLNFTIRDVHAPPEVHAAFRDVASAQEDKMTAINIAYRYLDETVNLARGEAAREIELAKAYRQEQVDRAMGQSEALRLETDAFRTHELGASKRLYLETMEDVLQDVRKIVRPGNGLSGSVDLWISGEDGTAQALPDVIRGSDVRGQGRMGGK